MGGGGGPAEEEVKTPDCPPEPPTFSISRDPRMNKQLPLTGDGKHEKVIKKEQSPLHSSFQPLSPGTLEVEQTPPTGLSGAPCVDTGTGLGWPVPEVSVS